MSHEPLLINLGNFRITLLEVWNLLSQCKIERCSFQSKFTSYVFQHLNLPLTTKLHAGDIICNEVIDIVLIDVCNLVSQSKNSTRDTLQSEPITSLFQCISLPQNTKFHVGTTICNEAIKATLLE